MATEIRTEQKKERTLIEFFGEVPDPRKKHNLKHKLIDILIIGVCGVIAGCNNFEEIEEWALMKEEFLRKFLELRNGIPSHDTINRVFSIIDPRIFFQCFMSWISEVRVMLGEKEISIDGKTLCGSRSTKFGKRSALHLVSAWSSQMQISLGQVRTHEKSNEITAIPELLNLLMIEGCIITIDAMGCQKEIAALIIEKKANYVLALKKNHGDFHEEVETYFNDVEKSNFKNEDCEIFKTIEKDHGRIEKRTVVITNNINWITQKPLWKSLQCIVMVIAERKEKDKKTIEKRYYITSLNKNAEKIAHIIRSHWSIENQLHWHLDVNFAEDYSRLRTKNNAENFSSLRKIALALLKQESNKPESFANDTERRLNKKKSIRCKRLRALLDEKYLLKIIGLSTF